MNENYYHTLGLNSFASVDEVKIAYRKLAKKYHPDRNPGNIDFEEKFKRISTAYKLLSKPDAKAEYDARLAFKLERESSINPRYAPPTSYYSSKKQEYTPQAWFYAKIFIVILIMAVILIPMGLLYYSSVRYYEKGEEAFKNGNVYTALINYNSAITLFGGRSAEAALKSAEIYLYHLNEHQKAVELANKALDYVESDEHKAYLYFLKATAHYALDNYEQSLNDFKLADSLNYIQDSIQLKMGFLNTFAFENFSAGQKNFEYLIDRNVKPATAYFGKAWCQQQRNFFKGAISSYSKSISYEDSSALTYFYRGRNYLQIQDTTAACKDFKIAGDLGNSQAESYFNFYCINQK